MNSGHPMATRVARTSFHRKGTLLALIALSLAALALWRFGATWSAFTIMAESWLLLAFAAIDLAQRRVPNRLLWLALPIVLLAGWVQHQPLVGALVGLICGYGVFWLLARARPGALGQGDVKLAGLLGLMVGFPAIVLALLITMLAGGLVAIALLVSGRARRGDTLAYAPYLALGGLLALYLV